MGHGVKLLLDTCTFIWLTQEPVKLSRSARQAIDDVHNELLLSHASIWEVHLKHLAGKLSLPEKPRLWFLHQLSSWHVADQPLDLESLHRTSELPLVHRDPFDRMLAAQAQVHQLTLVSPDDFFPAYHIDVIW